MKSDDKVLNSANPFTNIALDIRLIAMDVDGVMTDGGIYVDDNGMSYRKFNAQDGMGIRLIQNSGCEIAFISGADNKSVDSRAKSLDIKYVFTKIKRKKVALTNLQKKLSVKPEETIYLGDDINDIAVIDYVRLFISPSNSHQSCLKKADWVGSKTGGNGFIREFADLFCLARNIDPFQAIETTNS